MSDMEPKSAPPPEPSAETRPGTQGWGPLRAVGWLFALGLLAAGLLLGAVIYRVAVPPPEPETQVIRDTPDVVVAIRDLARLETAQFHIERVIDIKDRQSALFGLVDAEDALLLVAAADVTAGVDLTKLQDGDVVIEPQVMRATITLPPPEVFAARLDNDRTYVHTRETDTLADRNEHLETQARQEAERTLEQSALQAGLLERTRRNAESALSALVRSLGYREVVVHWRDQPAVEAQPAPETEPTIRAQ